MHSIDMPALTGAPMPATADPISKMSATSTGLAAEPFTTQDWLLERDGDGKIPTLTELLQVARQERAQATIVQRRLLETTRTHVALAETRRLALQARESRQLLVQCLRTERKDLFTTLYQGLADTVTQLEQREDVSGWFEELLPSSKATITTFLSRLRHNGNFLGSQLASIPPKTLLALLPQDSRESVLGGPVKETLSFDKALDETPAFLESFLLLTHGDMSPLATEVWATACARLITDQRSVHEKLVIHLINIWAGRSATQAMELWFIDTLQKGSFTSKMKTFRQHMYTNDDAREAFFDDALEKFLGLILDSLPLGALQLCSAMHTRLESSPKHYNQFPVFVATKWLFLSYIPKLLMYPESFGLLLGHHISEQTRIRIFKELCDRAQRIVFEVANPWRHQQLHQNHAKLVRAIIAAFGKTNQNHVAVVGTADHRPTVTGAELTSVAIAGTHLLSVLAPLVTPRKPESMSTLGSSLRSSASSISGFSIFQKDSASSIPGLALSQKDSVSSLSSHYSSEQPSMSIELLTMYNDLKDVVSAADEPLWSLFVMDSSTATTEAVTSPSAFEARESIGDLATPALVPETIPSPLPDLSQLELGSELPGSVLSDNASSYTESTGVLTAQSSKTSMTSIPEWKDIHAQRRSSPQSDQQLLAQLVQLVCHDSDDQQDLHATTRRAIMRLQQEGDHIEAYTLVRLLQQYDDLRLSDTLTTQVYDELHRLVLSQQQLLSRVTSADNEYSKAKKDLKVNEKLFKELRYKVWYTVSVRSSAIYEGLCNTVTALRAMEHQTRSGSIQARTTNNVLDLMSASPQHGGPNKLSNEQCSIVRTWLDQNAIEMLCTEERIHKLCMEIRQSVEALTNPSPTDNPMLWMDGLFVNDKPAVRRLRRRLSRASSMSSFNSPKIQPAYEAVLSLVVSDFNMFPHGSETDRALWTGLANDISCDFTFHDWPAAFDHHTALSHMMRSFSLTASPMKKLEILQSIQRLVRPDPDAWVSIFAEFRPPTLLRDMQYIASLLPSSTLDGYNAFWHGSIAIMKIKQKLVKSMLETADEIIAFHTNNRRHRPTTAQQQRDVAFAHPPNEMSYTMADAASLLEIAAKEDNPTAQRELATLYLTHPDLLRLIIAPLTPPKDVFRQELEGKWQDKQRCDPFIMCIAHHWMTLSSRGGDALAKEFIKQQQEMDHI